jgi:hypothetical protein
LQRAKPLGRIHAPFPFDVQHRNIIKYATDAPRDFEELKARIAKRIEAILKKEIRLGQVAAISSPVANVEGLSQSEIVALVAIAENLDAEGEAVSVDMIRGDIRRAGFTKIAGTLALVSLSKKGLATSRTGFGMHDEPFAAYGVTDEGLEWLMSNQEKLVLRIKGDDDDIPF